MATLQTHVAKTLLNTSSVTRVLLYTCSTVTHITMKSRIRRIDQNTDHVRRCVAIKLHMIMILRTICIFQFNTHREENVNREVMGHERNKKNTALIHQ